MGRLQDKVALITGAARGHAQAMAVRFAAEGALLAICDLIPAEELDTTTGAQVREAGSRALCFRTDVSDERQVNDMVARTLAEYGTIDILAPVVGIAGLPVGIYSAIRQDTAADFLGRSVAIIGLATPNFWLGIMVMIYPAIWWGWAPPLELVSFTEDPLGNLAVFLIPSLILGTASAAATMRMTRTMMLEVLRQDYIRTAWSKGMGEWAVVVRHAVKNALIPVVSLIGLQLPILVGGAVIMENIFNLPGLGRLLLAALNDRDYPMVSGINLFFATGVVVINLLIDLVYAVLDPRVRYD